MDYKVVMTEDAEADLDAFIAHLLFEKENRQAAAAVLDDFEATKESLKRVAGSLKLCDNPRLNALEYRRIVTVQSWTEQLRPERSASRIPARPGPQPLHFRTRLAAGASRVTE